MPQIGSNEKPFVVNTGTTVSKESRFRKGFNKAKYDENYARIYPDEKKVPDGKQDHQSIFELEGKFDNSGHNQGMKYNAEQRMKTVGY